MDLGLFFAAADPIVLGLLIGLMVIGLGLMFWFMQTRTKREDANYQNIADTNGWRLEKDLQLAAVGSTSKRLFIFRPSTTDGDSWSLTVSIVQNEKDASGVIKSTTWDLDKGVVTDGLILAGPRPADLPAGLDLGGGFVQAAMQMFIAKALGGESVDTGGLAEIKVADQAFANKYLIFATDAAIAERVLNENVRSRMVNIGAMLSKDQRPALIIHKNGVRIKSNATISKSEALAAIVELGRSIQ